MRNTRIFWQIFPAIVFITIVSLLIVGIYAANAARDFHIEQLQAGLESRSHLIERAIQHLYKEAPEDMQTYIRQAGRKAGTRITLINNQGIVLSDSNEDYRAMDNHAKRPEVARALAGEIGSSLRYSKTLKQSMLYVATPLQLDGNHGALRLALPTSSFDTLLQNLTTRLTWVGLVVFALAALMALYSARLISRPLEEMKRGAERLTKGRIDQLIKLNSDYRSVEMAGLAGALNQMAEEINRRIRVIIQQRNELEAVFASMADSVVAIDSDKKILRMNRAATDLFALSADTVQGKMVDGVIRNQTLLDLIDHALTENTPQKEQISFYDKTSRLELQTHAVPLCSDEETIGVLLVMHDLTKLNRLENIRQDFVANVSHELKTPVTAIKGYVETLLDDQLADREQSLQFLQVVAKQSNRLDAIINDLLALSRIENRTEAGDIMLTPKPVQPVLEAVVQSCLEPAAEKNISITIENEPELEAPLNQPLMEQALINLLINAVRYSPADTAVTLRSYSSETLGGKRFANISVVDQGPGIAKEHLPRLFERFYRCDKARGRDQGGTGLGLAIVKHIANAHNGHVDVQSILGKGSTFTISFPME